MDNHNTIEQTGPSEPKRRKVKDSTEVVERRSNEFECIDIWTTAKTRFIMRIRETGKDVYETTRIAELIAIFKNPDSRIGQLMFSSGEGAFGGSFQYLFQQIQLAGIKEHSVFVKKIIFDSGTPERSTLKYTDKVFVTSIIEVAYMFQRCAIGILKCLRMNFTITPQIHKQIYRSRLYQSVETIEITNTSFNHNLTIGRGVRNVKCVADPSAPEINKLGKIRRIDVYTRFRNLKSVSILHVSELDRQKMADGIYPDLRPTHKRKEIFPKDPSTSLYTFYGKGYVHDFIRPTDTSAEGCAECSRDNEIGHLPPITERGDSLPFLF